MHNLTQFNIIVFEPGEFDSLMTLYNSDKTHLISYLSNIYININPLTIYYTMKYYIIQYEINNSTNNINQYITNWINTNIDTFNNLIKEQINLITFSINYDNESCLSDISEINESYLSDITDIDEIDESRLSDITEIDEFESFDIIINLI